MSDYSQYLWKGEPLSGFCGYCQVTVDSYDPNHRVTSIVRDGRGVECVLRSDISPAEGGPLRGPSDPSICCKHCNDNGPHGVCDHCGELHASVTVVRGCLVCGGPAKGPVNQFCVRHSQADDDVVAAARFQHSPEYGCTP